MGLETIFFDTLQESCSRRTKLIVKYFILKLFLFKDWIGNIKHGFKDINLSL